MGLKRSGERRLPSSCLGESGLFRLGPAEGVTMYWGGTPSVAQAFFDRLDSQGRPPGIVLVRRLLPSICRR